MFSAIIELGTNGSGGETIFYEGISINCLGGISHVINNSYGVFIVVTFNRVLHGDTLLVGHIAVISLIIHKTIFFIFTIVGYFCNR